MTSFLIDPYRFGVAYDTDAQTYITAVEFADGQALESGVRDAINAFVVGCKADGIWAAIKASCILAGARTLSGALVPLVGTAPTNNNFVAGDYDRKTGLVGNRSTKYLNTNHRSNNDPQNNQHYSVYVSSAGTTTADRAHIGTTYTANDADLSDVFCLADGRLVVRSRNANAGTGNFFSSPAGSSVGLIGVSRASSASYQIRFGSLSRTANFVSFAPSSAFYEVFRGRISPDTYSDARLAFYSIGESLDVALLDSRVSTLISALAAAIP